MPDPDFVFTVMGMGSDPGHLDLKAGPLAVLFGTLYREAIMFVCDRMGVLVDQIEPDHRVLAAPRDLTIGAGVIGAGTVAATEWRWHAISAGRRFLTLAVIWTMDPALDGYAGATTGPWISRAVPTCTSAWTWPTRPAPACAPGPAST